MDKHTAIYLRVSSKSQDTRSQRADLDRWAGTHFGRIVWYEDRASGSTMARPGWARLWEAVESRQVERIVCWRIDRLGRNAIGLAELFDQLPRLGVDLVCLRDGFSGLDTPTGRLVAGIMAQVAVFEREVRAERQTAGIAAAKAAGKTWGGATNTGKRLKVNADQVATIREEKARGNSVSAIARITGLSRPTVYSVLASK